jgi:hypothetical protein
MSSYENDEDYEKGTLENNKRYESTKGKIPPALPVVRCSTCRKESTKKKPLRILWTYDPYALELYSKYEWAYFCRKCHYEAWADT